MSLEFFTVYATGTRKEIDSYLKKNSDHASFHVSYIGEGILFFLFCRYPTNLFFLPIGINIGIDIITRSLYSAFSTKPINKVSDMICPGVVGVLRQYFVKE